MKLAHFAFPILLMGCAAWNGAESPDAAGAADADATGTGTGAGAVSERGADANDTETAGAVLASGQTQRTIASLGDPARGGLWLETPLVKSEMPGRLSAVRTGGSAEVTLIPIPGAASAGSRISLEAMQKLGVSPGDLVELDVTAGG
ncbi:hypothetical protein [Pontibaca methylaminivorans]|uniref:D-galactarate dehydratase n=1 Tax=Pontibaca methylaminivorans TaxID=515897 RepID=A0A1R3WEC7_9RHOB|nr:hypothetical protein [Pontibaca methylaminivorans]SIT76541.1 hypothetical protein SAMN05421849_0537 [Pontibaca methylaminivorans]